MSFRLRSYQQEWKEATARERANGFNRLLLDAVGGSGKTSYAGALALEAWTLRKGRTLILENRDQLVRQTAKRFADETGLEVDIEMGKLKASPFAPLIVASVASLGRINRLTGFDASHFEYVFADEAHNSTSNLFLRIMRWFHYGSGSLAEGWVAPKDDEYKPGACVIGITATPDSYGNRNLGNFYQKVVARYPYLTGISDGWVVGIREYNAPVRIDVRALRRKATSHGMDISVEDQEKAIIPIIEELADQVMLKAAERKSMIYLPSKQCVLLMHEALVRRGMKTRYVLGDCIDGDDKTEEFKNHPLGTGGIALVLCAMYVEGADFPDTDTIGWFRLTESPTFYKQGILRCSRPLPGLVTDEMGAEGRKAAIAASLKPWALVISPFYVGEKIPLMSVTDLFVDQAIRSSKIKPPDDFTNAEKIRDYIKALEKAADKHAHRQPQTVDPVVVSVALKVANFTPQNAFEAAPACKEALDLLLANDIDTTKIKNEGEAQAMIAQLRLRGQLKLATPKQLGQLTLRLGYPPEKAALIGIKQAGFLIWQNIRYKTPEVEDTERGIETPIIDGF